MKRFLISAALGTALCAASANAHEHEAILGAWNTVAETPMGAMAADVMVSHGEAGYAVLIEDRAPADSPMPPMTGTISEVAVEGNTVTFRRALETPMGPMELHYTLTADGDALAGQAMSDFGGVPITGTRAAGE